MRSSSGAIWKNIARCKLQEEPTSLPTIGCVLRMCCAITDSMKEQRRQRIHVRRTRSKLLKQHPCTSSVGKFCVQAIKFFIQRILRHAALAPAIPVTGVTQIALDPVQVTVNLA